LQDAVDTARIDRDAKLTEALQLFASLQPTFAKTGRKALTNPATKSALQHVLELAPNHLSAKLLVSIAENKFPTTLSAGCSLYQISLISYPHRRYLVGHDRVIRYDLPTAVTAAPRQKTEK